MTNTNDYANTKTKTAAKIIQAEGVLLRTYKDERSVRLD